jgi:hypothetical protein
VRFFLDHDVPGEVARVLRYEGYQMTELREVLAVQATDVEVLGNSNRPKPAKKHPEVHRTGAKRVKLAKWSQKKSNKATESETRLITSPGQQPAAKTVPRAAPQQLTCFGSAYGDRTRISALRGPCPNRLDERANGPRMYRANK